MGIDRVIATPTRLDERATNEPDGVRPLSTSGDDYDSRRQWEVSSAAVDIALAHLDRSIRKRLRRNRLRRLFRIWWTRR